MTSNGRNRPEGGRWRELVRELGFHLGGVFAASGALLVVVPGLALGVSTLIVWVGLPVLALTLAGARWFADVERTQINDLIGAPLPPAVYRPAEQRLTALGDAQAWRDLIHALVAFPIRVGAAAVALGWTVISFGCAIFVVWEWALPRGDVSGLFGLITGHDSRVGELALNTTIGLVGLLLAPFVVAACTWLRVGTARALLTSPTASLRDAATRAEANRQSSARAEHHTLSKVERDIHDGPQQRLVRLSMDLESARRRLREDPAQASAYLDEALDHSREALSELRAVTRGIAPPILAERGLLAAVTAAAGRCPVDTAVHSNMTADPNVDPEVERAAYFMVAEALTNVAKHAGAEQARVEIDWTAPTLRVSIEDDGRGGAAVGKGHGLAGLHDRLAALGADLVITSPAGGPTRLSARFGG